jgi:hypothetical protein
MTSALKLLLALTLTAALAGCGGALPDGTTMAVKPASLQSCDVPEAVTVHWDFSASHPEVVTIELWVASNGAPALFASGGAAGKATTGDWAYPGQVFHARDGARGTEIGTVAIAGPQCPGG